MTDIENLSIKYDFDPKVYDSYKRDYYIFCNTVNNPEFSVEKCNIAYENLISSFVRITTLSFDELKPKEGATIYSPTKMARPVTVVLETEVTDIHFTFGLFREFYVATLIKNPHNIKFMKDEFWNLLFQLSTIGKFSFKERELPDKSMRLQSPQLFNKTGNYYKLLRNYFLYEIHYGRIRDLGSISVSWENSTEFSNLIPKICSAFQIIYRLNYLLWRHENKEVKM